MARRISLLRIYSGLCHAIATLQRSEGGRGGIRTLGRVSSTLAFQASTLSRSATLPKQIFKLRGNPSDTKVYFSLMATRNPAPPASDSSLREHYRSDVFLSSLSNPLCTRYKNHLYISNYTHSAYSFLFSLLRIYSGLCHTITINPAVARLRTVSRYNLDASGPCHAEAELWRGESRFCVSIADCVTP